MNLELVPRRQLESESVDRRILGAFILVDAVTRVPLSIPATIQVRRATVEGRNDPLRLPPHAVRIQQNRRGVFVIYSAPFFDAYTSAFLDPQAPEETAAGPLGLHVAVSDAGPQYLPQEFRFDLPRALERDADDAVFTVRQLPVFRAPSGPILDGWAVLRVRVIEAGTDPSVPLPGVLVRAFRLPHAATDAPIGAGMTDWRGPARGEALVPLLGLQRFRPGSAANVIETDHAITFEATRDSSFTAAAEQLPDVPRILAGTGPGLVRVVNEPPDPHLEVTRPTPPPVRVQAGREYVVDLTMP